MTFATEMDTLTAMIEDVEHIRKITAGLSKVHEGGFNALIMKEAEGILTTFKELHSRHNAILRLSQWVKAKQLVGMVTMFLAKYDFLVEYDIA